MTELTNGTLAAEPAPAPAPAPVRPERFFWMRRLRKRLAELQDGMSSLWDRAEDAESLGLDLQARRHMAAFAECEPEERLLLAAVNGVLRATNSLTEDHHA